MLTKGLYFKFLIVGIISILSIQSYSKEIIKYKKKLSGDMEIVFIGETDESQKNTDRSPDMNIHYLVLKKKNQVLDTVWKNSPGASANNYIQISDLYFAGNNCSFLLSTALGIQLIINTKPSGGSKWIVKNAQYILMNEKSMKLKTISLVDEKTVRCEYKELPTEIFKADPEKLHKYNETVVNGKTVLKEVEIKEDEGLIQLK